MIKINILRSNEEAKTLIDIHWRYWNLIFHFKKEFDELKIKFKFYFFKNIHDPKFYDCDYIFLDCRSFPRIKTYKDDIIDANYTDSEMKYVGKVVYEDTEYAKEDGDVEIDTLADEHQNEKALNDYVKERAVRWEVHKVLLVNYTERYVGYPSA